MIIWKCGGNVEASLHSVKVKVKLHIYLLKSKLGLQYFNLSSSSYRDRSNWQQKDRKIEWKKYSDKILFLIRSKELSGKCLVKKPHKFCKSMKSAKTKKRVFYEIDQMINSLFS